MLYSSAGFLALLIHLIINYDVLRKSSDKEVVPAHRSYRAFLLSITVYYITDILWGTLYDGGLIALTNADTALYFASMALSILLWTRYVVEYLKDKNLFGRLLLTVGWLLFAFEIIVVIANFFLPVLYSFEGGAYQAGAARYITLAIQILMFLMTAAYALAVAMRREGTMRLRHRTIALFSLAMTGFITAQALYPLLPLYAIGCMLGTCLLHTFVLENEKEEYRDQLETRLQESILNGNYYDLLTGLPGMSYFFELTDRHLARAEKRGSRLACLYLNLSGMKFYNKSHGFSGGDKLLRSLAQLLTAAFGEESCSRFGQDHFAVITEEAGLEDKLNKLFEDWHAQCGEGCPSILAGIYLDEPRNVDISTACDLAKIACDAIRTTYKSSFKYYDNAMLAVAEKQQYIIGHLDRAIAEGWIQVYYQPIVRAANGRVCDEEALARWIDPERGFLSPADFIPILEEAKLIYRLDLYMVEQVLKKLALQQAKGLFLVPQSINLSRADFDACDIVEEIRARVDAAGLPRRLITIEITESIVGSDFDFIKSQVERFRGLGFPVWMDDFGSGYSSLDVLQSLQVDLIKFDMRFMQQFDHEEKSKIILAELMKMAIGLGLDTVCEGVEREDQVEFLREIGCTKLQGFYYTRPLPLDEVFKRYETGTQIGFENPEESDYFNAIGRINLFDLAALAKEDEDSFQHYFSTIPMAIIEVQADRARFTRSNQAYRDFIQRAFGLNLSDLGSTFEDTPEGPGRAFVDQLHKCCDEGGRAVFDETLPSGTVVHSFMRRVTENPLTGTVAAAVAVLAINEAPRE